MISAGEKELFEGESGKGFLMKTRKVLRENYEHFLNKWEMAHLPVPFRSRNLLSAGRAGSFLAALAGSSVLSLSPRKAEAPVLLRQSDKKSPEKSGFDFLGDFVLTEELGAAAGHGVKCLPLQSTVVLRISQRNTENNKIKQKNFFHFQKEVCMYKVWRPRRDSNSRPTA